MGGGCGWRGAHDDLDEAGEGEKGGAGANTEEDGGRKERQERPARVAQQLPVDLALDDVGLPVVDDDPLGRLLRKQVHQICTLPAVPPAPLPSAGCQHAQHTKPTWNVCRRVNGARWHASPPRMQW